MAKLPSQEAAALAYAEVYTLVGWMQAKIGYKGLRDALAAQRDGKSARRAVAEAMNLPWPSVEKEWHAHLKVGDGKARAGKPIKFGKGGVDSENVGIETVAPRARKHARLGGMLRARGMLEAAAVEYEKALAAGGGARSVRRGQARAHARRARPVRPRDRARDAARRRRRPRRGRRRSRSAWRAPAQA